MDYLILWFILTGAGSGRLEPMTIRAPQCGLPGVVVGLIVDRKINPTAAMWPDPKTVGEHCRVDISAKVAELAGGEYHLATTEMGKMRPFGSKVDSYIGVDPHTSEPWIRAATGTKPKKPAAVRITP